MKGSISDHVDDARHLPQATHNDRSHAAGFIDVPLMTCNHTEPRLQSDRERERWVTFWVSIHDRVANLRGSNDECMPAYRRCQSSVGVSLVMVGFGQKRAAV